MSDYEQIIAYRRQLREEQETVRLRWGVPQLALNDPQRRMWHLTRHDETPATAECGVRLVELLPRKARQPWKTCKKCKASEHFVDLWQQS